MTDASLPRRSFLAAAATGIAGAAVAIAGAPAFAEAAASARSSNAAARGAAAVPAAAAIKLGVASYSLREFPLDKALVMMKALRTPYVNLKSVHMPYDKTPAELAAIRQTIETAGFQIVGGGTITFDKDTDADVEKYFAYAKNAGMPTIVCTMEHSILPRVEKYAKQYDIKVAIHNHGPEDKHFPSPYDVLKAVNGMDPRMGLCMDIGHATRAGANIVQAVLDAGPRLLDMHIKDLADGTARDSQVAVGEGKLPIPALFRALQKINFAGYVNLEYEINAKDPLPGMQVSFAYMRGVLAGMA
ncbi:MAG: sugar phosphate isomerase/epimerase [Polaromonas sp.]|nr:sugar phosphate isomerase/epimerase [Gemmatimonadaceae bacterium]